MTFLRCLLFAFLVVQIPLAMARKHDASNVNVPAMVDHAKAMVANGRVDPRRDLGPLLDRLATSHDESELDAHLISGIEDMGQYDWRQSCCREGLLARDCAPSLAGGRRQQRPMEHAWLGVVGTAQLRCVGSGAGSGDCPCRGRYQRRQKLIRFRGELLANWKKSRPAAAPLRRPASSLPRMQIESSQLWNSCASITRRVSRR